MKLLWIDTETTGLDPQQADIVQLSGIVIINGKEIERFNFYSQPVRYETIQQASLDVTGLTVEKLKTFPLPQEMYKNFCTILAKYVDRYDKNDKFYPAGQNVQFDMSFLKSFFEKMGDNFVMSYFYHHNVDLIHLVTMLQTAGCINLQNFKLETIAKYLNVQYNSNLHNAEVDIDLTRRCYCKLAAQYINFHDYEQSK